MPHLASLIVTTLLTQTAPVDWHTDLAAAELIAHETGRPLCVVFR